MTLIPWTSWCAICKSCEETINLVIVEERIRSVAKTKESGPATNVAAGLKAAGGSSS